MSVSVKKMGRGGASEIVQAKSSREDPRALEASILIFHTLGTRRMGWTWLYQILDYMSHIFERVLIFLPPCVRKVYTRARVCAVCSFTLRDEGGEV